MSQQNLVNLLQQNGLVSADESEQDDPDSPWFVKILLAFSGWLASLFMLGFFGALFSNLFTNAAACLFIGSLLIVAAYFVLRMPQSEFMEHLGLAVSLAGQVLIAVAIFQTFKANEAAPWLLVAIIQIGLAVIMSNFVHGVFSSLLAAIAFSIAFSELNLVYLSSSIIMFAVAWLWLNEFSYVGQYKKTLAIAYGLTLSLAFVKGTVLFSADPLFGSSVPLLASTWMGTMDELLNCLVLLYVAWQLIKQTRLPLNKAIVIPVLLAVLLFSLSSFQANGLVVGLVITLLGFSASNRILLGLGIASLLFYVSAYYYLLDTTLLVKSGTLLAVGLLLLVMRWLLASNVRS